MTHILYRVVVFILTAILLHTRNPAAQLYMSLYANLPFCDPTGGVLQGFMFPFNLGRLGNGISWWLGIHPYELFFYIFLPPLLCDSAVRIDFFLFKQVSRTIAAFA